MPTYRFMLPNGSVILGVTGSSSAITPAQSESAKMWMSALKAEQNLVEMHHGDCIKADAKLHDIAIELGIPVIIHPPRNNRKRAFCLGYTRRYEEKEYLERNRDIVLSATEMLACPDSTETTQSGTWYTVRQARKKGIRITLIWPDGRVEVEKAKKL